jgi:hypothetical protein
MVRFAPPLSTIFLGWILGKFTRGHEGADKANDLVLCFSKLSRPFHNDFVTNPNSQLKPDHHQVTIASVLMFASTISASLGLQRRGRGTCCHV